VLIEKKGGRVYHAQPRVRLWLLGSPPDQIHGLNLHGTRPKKLLTCVL